MSPIEELLKKHDLQKFIWLSYLNKERVIDVIEELIELNVDEDEIIQIIKQDLNLKEILKNELIADKKLKNNNNKIIFKDLNSIF